MSFTLNDGADTDGARSAELRQKAKNSCQQSAISARKFHQDMENLNISKAQDAQERADEESDERHMKGPLMHTPPPSAGGAMKRITMVGGFGAELLSEKEPLGRYQSSAFDDGDWNKSDAGHPDKKVAGDKDACSKIEAYHPDKKVAGLVDMFSSESSPGAGTPSTEESCAGGEEDDILDKLT